MYFHGADITLATKHKSYQKRPWAPQKNHGILSVFSIRPEYLLLESTHATFEDVGRSVARLDCSSPNSAKLSGSRK